MSRLPRAARYGDDRPAATPGGGLKIDIHSHVFDRGYFDAMMQDMVLEHSVSDTGQTMLRKDGYLSEKTASSKWVNWEIEESLKRRKGVVGVYKGNTPPAKTPPAFQQNACKTVKWEHEALMKAIEDANAKR